MASPQSALESETESSSSNGKTSGSGNKNKVVLADNFPSKTYLVIEHCDRTDSDVACWSDDGTFFMVKNTAEFAASHLPQYFKHSNFQSFVRQLNIYGWRTVKHHDSGDGKSVAFYHKRFLRGRRDLLKDIKRSKKSSTKKSLPPPGDKVKVEDTIPSAAPAFNARFDEIQLQMDSLSKKLDLLISLVTGKQDAFVDAALVGGKRRRRATEDSPGSPLSDVTDPTASNDSSSSQTSAASASPAKVASMPDFHIGMYAPFEEIEMFDTENGCSSAGPRQQYRDFTELRESRMELNECHQHQAALKDSCDQGDQDEFKEYIDRVLDGHGEQTSGSGGTLLLERDQDERSEGNSVVDASTPNALFADRLMSKANPETVQGQLEIPQMTASVVCAQAHSNQTYDEEAAGENAISSSTPLTTAVAVTDAADISRKRSRRRAKLFFAVAFLMAMAAFIIWPLVIITGRKRKPPPPPPKRHDSGSHSGREYGGKNRDNVFDAAGGNQTESLRDAVGDRTSNNHGSSRPVGC